MQKNQAGKWVVFAFDRTTNIPKTGDAANITANIRIDGGAANPVDDLHPTELEDGYYVFDITAAEFNGDYILISPESTTANIQVIGVPGTIWTTDIFATFGTAIVYTAGNTLVSELIDKVLSDLAQPTDITTYWSRTDVLIALDYIQREISRMTENVFATTALIEPAASTETIIIDANGNFLRGVSAYRTYGGLTKEIPFYSEEQVSAYDVLWKPRTAPRVLGILTDITSPGVGRLYPIPDNANNDIIVNYIKQSAHITSEYVVAGDADNQLSSWVFKGITYNNTNNGVLYWSLTNSGATRTVDIYKSSFAVGNKVATGSLVGDGVIILSAVNSSGLTGSVTVAYTLDDADASNSITFATIEIPNCDVPCLEYGMKALIYDLETDGKDTGKQSLYKRMYGSIDPATLQLTGELAAVRRRVTTRRGTTYNVVQERFNPNNSFLDRPLYPWEA